MKVQVDNLQRRILAILRDWYPITVEELRDELGLRKDVLERSLKSLMVRGLIQLEPLSDKTYIRLLAPEAVQELVPDSSVARRKRPKKEERDDSDSMMYR